VPAMRMARLAANPPASSANYVAFPPIASWVGRVTGSATACCYVTAGAAICELRNKRAIANARENRSDLPGPSVRACSAILPVNVRLDEIGMVVALTTCRKLPTLIFHHRREHIKPI
jgi:hypothetical protein